MQYDKFFITWAENYKQLFQKSPYIKYKINEKKSINVFSEDFVAWIMQKFAQSVQKELELNIGIAGIKVQLINDLIPEAE